MAALRERLAAPKWIGKRGSERVHASTVRLSGERDRFVVLFDVARKIEGASRTFTTPFPGPAVLYLKRASK